MSLRMGWCDLFKQELNLDVRDILDRADRLIVTLQEIRDELVNLNEHFDQVKVRNGKRGA